MVSLKEYIDHHASHWSHTNTIRGRDDLHALRTLATWLYLIQQRRALGHVYIDGHWNAPQEKGQNV